MRSREEREEKHDKGTPKASREDAKGAKEREEKLKERQKAKGVCEVRMVRICCEGKARVGGRGVVRKRGVTKPGAIENNRSPPFGRLVKVVGAGVCGVVDGFFWLLGGALCAVWRRIRVFYLENACAGGRGCDHAFFEKRKLRVRGSRTRL